MRQIKALALAAMLVPAAAHAVPKTYTFGGTLEGTFTGGGGAGWQFASGQSFSGTLVYDPAAISYSFDYINSPDWTLTFHRSPIVSMNVSIDLGGGQSYNYNVATGGNAYAAVGAARNYGWSGIDLRLQNYNFDGSPQVAEPASAYVGTYRPHSTFLSIESYDVHTLTSTGADIDLAALFDATPVSYYRTLNMRFSDSARPWNGFSERIDGTIGGRLTSFALVPTAVPEPANWALLIVGFAAAGYARHRRSNALNLIAA